MIRLLEDDGHGNLGFVEKHDIDIPRYAILSHTWGAEGDEVTFKDLTEGTGRNKIGYKKIEFCRERAASDGLQHFWVDTCCINKSSSAELNEAINSMFRWYQGAHKCYVFLSDVPPPQPPMNAHMSLAAWHAGFRESRWFSRGWTLQELIAPTSVEFFSRGGIFLGSKRSLEEQIHDVTGISIRALRGEPLNGFSVEERLSWAKQRETKRPEDKAYSLLGIFGVYLPQIYGEGSENALGRLRDEIKRKWDPDTSHEYQLLKTISQIGDAAYDSYENQRHRSCLTDTRVDLLQEITKWATCNSPQYIFWLRGRAGTGKSTIALTMAQILDRHNATLASFFFKRGGGDLARSRRVISTIVYQLAMRSRLFGGFVCDALRDNPSLGDSASLSQQYDKLLLRPLQHFRQSAPQSPPLIVVLDALDECDDPNDVRLLLRLLGDTQSLADLGFRVLATSRPETPIRLGFRNMKHITYHELALHDVPRAIVDHDIQRFVTHELLQIQNERVLPSSWPGEHKIRIITSRADGLFIYAAAVCRYVNGPRQVSPIKRLDQVCQGGATKHKSTDALDKMYLMILDSSMRDDFSAQEAQEVTLRLRQVVGSVILLLENLSSEDLARLLFPSELAGGVLVQDTLDSLHAIFDVPENLSRPIQMLHLSVRDFLVDRTRCPDVRFHIDQQQMHLDLFDNCLDLMKRSLQKDICHLSGPGCLVDEVSEATLSHYLTPTLRYTCRYWMTHAEYGHLSLSDNGPVYNFLRQCWPYWLEVMGLIRKVPEAITMMIQLVRLINVKKAPKLHALVQDILRVILTFNSVLAKAPLQLYNAGIIFSPAQSVFRRFFCSHASVNLEVRTQILSEWNACIYTLEGHFNLVASVVFSPDGSRVASGSWDNTVRVWDVQTGQCQHTLEGHSGSVASVVFSPDGSRVASGSWDNTVRVWDVQTGQCQHTLEGHSGSVASVVFSPDGSRVASGSWDNTVRVWDVQTGQCQHTLEGHSGSVASVVFSPDGSRVASGSWDNTVRVWDVQTGQCQHTLEGHSGSVASVVFSPDGSRVASGSSDNAVRVWDLVSSTEILCYDTGAYKHNINFSEDSSQVLVNGSLLSLPPQTPFSSASATTSSTSLNLSESRLAIKDDWVILSSERTLWLPPEYRPGDWASYGDTIVIGSGTGRVTFVRCITTGSLS